LVDTGSARFITTAGHVVREMRRPDLSWIMGGRGRTVLIDGWTELCCDESLDVGTIAVPADFEPSGIGRRFFCPPGWPPPVATPGEMVAFVGFPGALRTSSGRRIDAGFVSYIGRVESCGEERIVVALGDDVVPTVGQTALPSFGGMSGASVFVSNNGRLILTAIINHCNVFDRGIWGSNQRPIDRGAAFYAAHAAAIAADGTRQIF
jgi:hypothetical protein